MPSSYQLVMRSGPSAGKVFPLEKGEIVIGRDLNNDVVINDPEISRRHARLYAQGSTYVLEDLGSTNGTFVGGQRLTGAYPMRVGELITSGERLTVVFEMSQPAEDATMVSSAQQPPVYQPPIHPQAQAGQVQGPAVQPVIQQPVSTPAQQIPMQPAQVYQQPAQAPVHIPAACPLICSREHLCPGRFRFDQWYFRRRTAANRRVSAADRRTDHIW
jgi:pSer/pThr/pTyr-binding forkhead associated (FHA) protein